MRLIKRLVYYALLLGIIGIVFLGARTYIQQRDVAELENNTANILDQAVVERGDLEVTVGGTGSVRPAREVPLMFEAPGVVGEILVSEGDFVAAGEVIARLETVELESALASAQIALDAQQIAFDALTAPPREADISVAQAAVDSAQAALYAAYATAPSSQQIEISRLQTELSRNRLWQAQLQRDLLAQSGGVGINISGLIPESVDVPEDILNSVNSALSGAFNMPTGTGQNTTAGLNQAEFGVEIADANFLADSQRTANMGSVASAQAALANAQANLDRLLNGASEIDLQIAAAGLRQAQLAVQEAQLALDRTQIIAPFDGTIAEINLTVNEPPPSDGLSSPVLMIDTSEYQIDFAIDETDIVNLAVGQSVQLRFDAIPDTTLTGRITRINPTPSIRGQLVSFPVRVTIDPTEAPVRLGMSATAAILVDQLEDALILPNRFIRIDRATQDAFVTIELSPGRYEEIPVEIGLRNETESQIVSGLNEGDRVVLVPRGSFDPIAQQTGQTR
ncbi:MAG: secretion protein HlyD family protein [Chloroflexi bacterium OLB15]|nr:MAG: secretion protein HlyD family protein [Chloroflexi bacterium OLB15]